MYGTLTLSDREDERRESLLGFDWFAPLEAPLSERPSMEEAIARVSGLYALEPRWCGSLEQ